MNFMLNAVSRHMHTDPSRQKLKDAKRVVVKVGTAVVANSDGTMSLSRMGALVEKLRELKLQGREVLLVSSGAMGLGRQSLGLSKEVVGNPDNIIDRQACAAAGQELLMSMYHMMFSRLDVRCAQVLITQEDFVSRQRYMHLTDTLDKLTSLGTIPIINENDVVTGGARGEQVFSDNDKLSAILAAGADADGLALLTDVEAVFTKPPGEPGAERIKIYKEADTVEIGAKSGMGRGGMAAKITAARVAARGGVATCIASGYDLENITKVFGGLDVGTYFEPDTRPNKRQRWLTLATECVGKLIVGAKFREALERGTDPTLYVSDLIGVSGSFPVRSVISLIDEDGHEFARGITQKKSAEIKDALPTSAGKQHSTFTTVHVVIQPSDILLLG